LPPKTWVPPRLKRLSSSAAFGACGVASIVSLSIGEVKLTVFNVSYLEVFWADLGYVT
jgi:hypothetical protein